LSIIPDFRCDAQQTPFLVKVSSQKIFLAATFPLTTWEVQLGEDKIEEETYSLIFKTLKHPLRRKILRMLAEKPRSYSEILEALAIDSGHLSYHIENLGDIIARTKNEKYALSAIGQATVKLMNGVEEQHSSTKTVKHARRISKTALIFSTIFAIALLTWTVYALTFTTQQQTMLFATNQEFEKVPIVLLPNQKQNYTISLESTDLGGTGYSIGTDTASIFFSPSTDTATEWNRRFSDTLFQLSGTWDITITVYGCDGQILDQRREGGNISSPVILTLNFEFTEPGDYTLQFENLGGEFTGTLIPQGNQVTYRKPLFNYGITGIIVLMLYPFLLFLSRKLIT
jgi:hypothetical protein